MKRLSEIDKKQKADEPLPAALVAMEPGTGYVRAFKITSNSWEGTGDGHALAGIDGHREYNSGCRNTTGCCTKVCPEHIHITGNAIYPAEGTRGGSLPRPGDRLLRVILG